MAKYKGFDDSMDDPLISDSSKDMLFAEGVRSRKEEAIRADLARNGYKLMHRRRGQYWLMLQTPMTLDGIEQWLKVKVAA